MVFNATNARGDTENRFDGIMTEYLSHITDDKPITAWHGICEYLNKHGISVCKFIKNNQGEYLSKDEKGRTFHVQHLVEGNTDA